MSEVIGWEAHFWLYSVVLGAALLLLYDLIRIVRRVFPHKLLAVSMEDFLYWMVSGCFMFRMLYQFNYGIIRWFAVMGMLVGMFLYHITISLSFVKITSTALRRIVKWLKGPLNWLRAKIKNKKTKFNSKRKKVTNSLKKKLKRNRKPCNMEVTIKDGGESVGKGKNETQSSETTE